VVELARVDMYKAREEAFAAAKMQPNRHGFTAC